VFGRETPFECGDVAGNQVKFLTFLPVIGTFRLLGLVEKEFFPN